MVVSVVFDDTPYKSYDYLTDLKTLKVGGLRGCCHGVSR